MIPDDFASPCANTHLINRELEETVNKFGSLITLFSNKPVSCVTMFIIIQKHPVLQQALIDLSETSWYDVVEYLAHRYPVLNKTKKIK
jgi:ureidoglycolate hydrolase